MVHRTLTAVILALALASPASSQMITPWPAEGAPVCTAPGDQLLVPGSLVWLDHAGASDTLHYGYGWAYPALPQGDCGAERVAVPGSVVQASVSLSIFHTGVGLGCPGCGEVVALAHAWISRDANADQALIRSSDWPQSIAIARAAAPGTLSSPSAAANGTGFPLDTAAVVVWAEDTGTSTEVRAQRLGWHGAPEWNAPGGIVIAAHGSLPSVQRARSSYADGSVIVVWRDQRGPSADIYVLRLNPDGTPYAGWPATGLALEGRSEDSDRPILVDAVDAFYVAWEESGARFGGGRDIVVRKLGTDGLPDPAWPDSGVVVSSLPTVDHLEDVTGGLDAVGVLWSDTRAAGPGNPNDLYTTRLNSNGTHAAGLPADGVAVSTAAGSQDHARGAGGFYAWEDTRSGEPKVYATRLDDSGHRVSGWNADGNPASTAAGEQREPEILGGSNGTLVAWRDGRDAATNGFDIYVQSFLFDGTLGTVGVDDGRLPPRVALRAPFPNPSRDATHLRLELPHAASVHLAVYDLLGRRVRLIAEGALEPGAHDWDWRGTNDAGTRVPAGLYHVRAVVDGVAATRSVVRIY